MARQRQDPRAAPRHSGDLWERGHQLRPDRNFKLTLGPFQGTSPTPMHGDELITIRSLEDGLIRNGLIQGWWKRESTFTTTNQYVLDIGPKAFPNGSGTAIHVPNTPVPGTTLFFDAYDTGDAVSNPDLIDFVRIGSLVYYVRGTGLVKQYNPGAATDADVAGSPSSGRFIFMLDNNLVVVTADTIYWSVDGAPTDFASIGSGSNPIPAWVGLPLGYAVLHNGALIAGTYGAIWMTSTGTLPAFKFVRAPTFPGIGYWARMAGADDKIFYISEQGVPMVWYGEQSRPLGGGKYRVVTADLRATISPLPRLGLVCIAGNWVSSNGSTSDPRMVFFDINTLEAVGQWSSTLHRWAIQDYGVVTSYLKLYAHNGNTHRRNVIAPYDSATCEAPTIQTHRLHLGHRVQLSRIDLLWEPAFATITVPNATVAVNGENNATEQAFTTTRRQASARRSIYDCNIICDNFDLNISGGTWYYSDVSLKAIQIYGSVVAEDDVEVLD